MPYRDEGSPPNWWFRAAFVVLFLAIGWAWLYPNAKATTFEGFVSGMLQLLAIMLSLVGWWRRP